MIVFFFHNTYSLRMNEALYQQGTSYTHVYSTEGIFIHTGQLYGSISLAMSS